MRLPGNRFIVIVGGLILVAAAGCKDKTPYPSVDRLRPIAEADVAVAPEPPAPVEQPSRVLAFVRTPRGTAVVAGRDTGDGIVVSHIPGHAWAMDDGTIRVIKVSTRAPETDTPKRRSSMAGLVMEEYASDGTLARKVDLTPERTASHSETSGFIKDAVSADPDMAGEYYYVEKIVGIGSDGPRSVWLATTDSWLGGAHPSSSARLLVVDAELGKVVDLSDEFEGRDVVREVLRERYDAACVRDNCGVAPMEGPGGDNMWVVLLCASFGSCEGQHEFRLVEGPGAVPDPTRLVLEEQTLVIPDVGTVEKGVVDFRVADNRKMAVVEMALGSADEIVWPWTPARGGGERSRTREVRFWTPGMAQPAVIGRMPEIQSVQFMPRGTRSVDLLAAVRKISD